MKSNLFEFRNNFLIDEKITETKALYEKGEFESALKVIKNTLNLFKLL